MYRLSFLTLMAAPLQDSCSLESRKPISLNSQRAARRDAEVLHSNSQPSALITARGQRVQDGGSRRAEKWAQSQDASLSIQSSPTSCSLLSYPLRSKPLQRVSGQRTVTHTDTFFCGKFIYIHAIPNIHTKTFSVFPFSISQPQHIRTNKHKLQLEYTLCPLRLYYICISSRPGESAATASRKEVTLTRTL